MIDYAVLGFVAPQGTIAEQLAALAGWKASPSYAGSDEMDGGPIRSLNHCPVCGVSREIRLSSYRGDPWAVDEGGCTCERGGR